uniref:hypothetical protein n=1 Tax=Escherichia coli TaxID=562 RepID=UPI00202E21CB|nr:hypothetical protein [Escherichia coli]
MHQDGVNSLALALTAAFCGANQHDHSLLVCSGFAGRRDGPVHPGMFVSGCAALRGDVAPLLPGIFFRPFYPLARIIIYGESVMLSLSYCVSELYYIFSFTL